MGEGWGWESLMGAEWAEESLMGAENGLGIPMGAEWDCDLINLKLQGYPFTWERRRDSNNWIEERLDKAFVTVECVQIFCEDGPKVLPNWMNIVLRQRKKKGEEGYMVVKLDMSKAYNKVEWPFLESMLLRMGFVDKWVGLVLKCVNLRRGVLEIVEFVDFSLDQWIKAQGRGNIPLLHLLAASDGNELWTKLVLNIKINVDATLFEEERKFGFGFIDRNMAEKLVVA
uniref:Reverse transcriptase n=1 Tax=Cannabis sativa TaxID=3483 RepID=A0A803NX06_CANSA